MLMPKPLSPFWPRWIIGLSLFLIVYGLAMMFVPQMMYRTFVGPLLYGNNESLYKAFVSMNDTEGTFLNVLSGLLGTVTIGWAIQMAWIAHQPFRNGERWAWMALALSVSVWAILEFVFKLVDGINSVGLVAHFSLLVAFAIPLAATYRDFHRTTGKS
jgi:hypothetical protein